MTKVEFDDIKSNNRTSLYLSTAEETLFYCGYKGQSAKTVYFFFVANSKSIETFQACCTNNSTPIDWSSCEGCYRSINQKHSRSKDGKYEFYEKYDKCDNYDYIIVKYPPSSLYKLEVQVSSTDFYENVKKDNEADVLWGIIIFICVGIPVIGLAILITIIVCCCICLRKKRTQGMVNFTQPYAAPVPPNTMSPMITQTPVNQENLLYNKPS